MATVRLTPHPTGPALRRIWLELDNGYTEELTPKQARELAARLTIASLTATGNEEPPEEAATV